jgi:hypothetical protein
MNSLDVNGKPRRGGYDKNFFTIDRSVFVTKRMDGKGARAEDSDEERATIVFTEEEGAQRIAKAIVRSAELCGADGGGEDKDPFK